MWVRAGATLEPCWEEVELFLSFFQHLSKTELKNQHGDFGKPLGIRNVI
jgi:hypothetical protein